MLALLRQASRPIRLHWEDLSLQNGGDCDPFDGCCTITERIGLKERDQVLEPPSRLGPCLSYKDRGRSRKSKSPPSDFHRSILLFAHETKQKRDNSEDIQSHEVPILHRVRSRSRAHDSGQRCAGTSSPLVTPSDSSRRALLTQAMMPCSSRDTFIGVPLSSLSMSRTTSSPDH